MQKSFLREATSRYRLALPGSPAEEYLAKRALLNPTVEEETRRFCLGYVADPLPGHDQYAGMLAIPYLRRGEGGAWSVVSIRFRCIDDHEHIGHGKYNTVPGDRPRLFNTLSLMTPASSVAITEGEIDAITLKAAGVDAIGVPGATAWRSWFREPFLGYEKVWVIADGDDPGMRFASTVASLLPNGVVVPCPLGMDTNDLARDGRINELLERMT